ncbi:MAG: hypothetical protein R3C68_01265 [Myxococcota bacterium]
MRKIPPSTSLCTTLILLGSLCFATSHAHASSQGVGIGVAGGAAFSPTKINENAQEIDVGSGFAWGFFVDIPLLETFYISPAAILYELDFGEGTNPLQTLTSTLSSSSPSVPYA